VKQSAQSKTINFPIRAALTGALHLFQNAEYDKGVEVNKVLILSEELCA
jgi:hypothetical protein